MAKTLEQLAKDIFKECKVKGEEVTMEEALEMAKMELGAKEIKNYTQATIEKKKTKREIKPDEEKVRLMELFNYCLLEPDRIDDDLPFKIENVFVKNAQKEIVFNVGENEYSLTLTKHRPPKKQGGLFGGALSFDARRICLTFQYSTFFVRCQVVILTKSSSRNLGIFPTCNF